eukprot:3784813-Rhodomonas_salina.4
MEERPHKWEQGSHKEEPYLQKWAHCRHKRRRRADLRRIVRMYGRIRRMARTHTGAQRLERIGTHRAYMAYRA